MPSATHSDPLKPFTDAEWYDRLATLQEGYFYPWRSILPAWHGEDVFRSLLALHLQADLDVLEVACAQGELALETAASVRSLLAYDRVADYIRLAQASAQTRGIHNVTLRLHDSSSQANGGHPHIPAADGSFDLLVCSKGPFHWIEDARRVARPGACLLMLVPDATPMTPWHARLPDALRWQAADDPNWARPAIERRLAMVQLSLDSWWSFDVPEIFPTAQAFYAWRTWGKSLEESCRTPKSPRTWSASSSALPVRRAWRFAATATSGKPSSQAQSPLHFGAKGDRSLWA
jgi:SAM-dependent methyltransferase